MLGRFQDAGPVANHFLFAVSGQFAESRVDPFDFSRVVGNDDGIGSGGQGAELQIHLFLSQMLFGDILDDADHPHDFLVVVQDQFAQPMNPAHLPIV